MSKYPQSKRKSREVKKTVLLYCEGAHEKAFLHYLKTVFARGRNVFVKIKENYGYGANGVLNGVLRQELSDQTVCVYDTDTGVDNALKNKVEQRGILCFENTPCFDAFLLEILEGKSYSDCKSDDCKKRFEREYLNASKRTNKDNYAKLFPEKLLRQKAEKMGNLGRLIEIINLLK